MDPLLRSPWDLVPVNAGLRAGTPVPVFPGPLEGGQPILRPNGSQKVLACNAPDQTQSHRCPLVDTGGQAPLRCCPAPTSWYGGPRVSGDPRHGSSLAGLEPAGGDRRAATMRPIRTRT